MAQNEKEAQRPDANGLARAAIGGDQAALLKLVELLRDDVYRLAKRMLGHPADAEDAAQEALIQIVTSLSSFRARARCAPGRFASQAATTCAFASDTTKAWSKASTPSIR